MNSHQAIEKLYSLQKFGIKLGLQNIHDFLRILGDPQNEFKSFHIAGTNGKGSTASFISSILIEENHKTGLYTSPHFVKFNERIRINGKEISDDYIINFVEENQNYIDEKKLTFFEVTTAMALKYFAENKIDFAVIETGLGGRLDATNIINPLASVITSIALEHTEILGNSFEKIAYEKGGIIKENSKIFLGKIPSQAQKILQEIAFEKRSEIYKLPDFIEENKNELNFKSEEISIKNIQTGLTGNYQKYNAALAILTLSKTIVINNINNCSKGILTVKENSGIQGRYEIYNQNPKIIFDSAHNPEGIETFLSSFKNEAVNYTNRVLLFGAMKDKQIDKMLFDLKKYFNEFHFTSIDNERSLSENDFKEISERLQIRYQFEKAPSKFIYDFIHQRKDECLVIIGSMYVLGSIKEELAKKST